MTRLAVDEMLEARANLGGLQCAVRAVQGHESKKVLSGHVLGALLIGLAACVPLAKEIRNPEVRAGLAGLILVGGAVSFLHAFYSQTRMGKKIKVYERGLICTDHTGSQIFLWEEVASVRDELVQFLYRGIPSYTNRFIRLRNAAGEVLQFGGPPQKIAAAAEAVVGLASARIEPRIQQRLQQGQTVDFGGLRLSPERIETAAGALVWRDLESAALADGRLRLYQCGRPQPWAEIGLRNLDNCQAFFRVLQQMLNAPGLELSHPRPTTQRI